MTKTAIVWTIRLAILAVIIALLFFLISTCSGGSCITKIDKSLPSVESAPWQVETPTHLYYATTADKRDNGDVLMSGWYERTGGKWKLQTKDILLDASLYGDIKVFRR